MDEQLKQNIMLAIVAGGFVFMILNLALFYFIMPGQFFLSVIISILVGGGVGAGTFFVKKAMDG